MLTGPLLFIQLIGLSGSNLHIQEDLYKTSKRFLISGAIIYLISMSLEIIFNSESATVIFERLNLFLVPVYLFLIFKLDIFRNKISAHFIFIICLLIIILHVSSSQSAYEAGIYPYISLIAHIGIAGMWSAGLCLLMFKRLSRKRLSNKIEYEELEYKYFIISTGFLILLLVTGAILFVSNVHNIAVLDVTEYGRYLQAF